MKKHIVSVIGCIAVTLGIVGCAHTSTSGAAPAQGTQQENNQRQNAEQQEKQQVAIKITRDGTLTVAGKPCPPNQLTARLSGMRARKAVIHADPQVPYFEVLSILSACKSAGVEQVSIAPNK